MAAAGDIVNVDPGGIMLLTSPVDGWAVGAGASDVLRIANGAAVNAITYDIVVWGTSA